MTTNVNLGFVAAAGGTVNAITATYSPAPTALVDKMLLWFRATGANTSTTPTFSPNGLTARTIVKQGGTALVAGDIPAANAIMEVVYDATNTRWELLNPAVASATASYLVYTALLSQTGTNPPTATVLQNTIGSIVWTRNSQGVYEGTLANAFAANKTTVFLAHTGGIIYMVAYRPDVNTIQVETTDASPLDGILDNTAIEIRVYP